jgi:hypothetical protein
MEFINSLFSLDTLVNAIGALIIYALYEFFRKIYSEYKRGK